MYLVIIGPCCALNPSPGREARVNAMFYCLHRTDPLEKKKKKNHWLVDMGHVYLTSLALAVATLFLLLPESSFLNAVPKQHMMSFIL